MAACMDLINAIHDIDCSYAVWQGHRLNTAAGEAEALKKTPKIAKERSGA